jgi:hypothetical protein
VAKINSEQQAIQALAQALADPKPKVLFGSAKKPGIFNGSSQPIKKAAQLCLDEKWLMPTGEYDGTGRTRKETYRVTEVGAKAAIERSEPVQLLKQTLAATQAIANSRDELLHRQEELLQALQKQQEETQRSMARQQTLIETALKRLQMPASQPLSNNNGQVTSWHTEALQYLQAYQTQHIQAFCSLPDLYANIVQKHGASIGQFHDGIRDLVQKKQVRLHPFTGARFALDREEYALMAGKEIMFYAERLPQS